MQELEGALFVVGSVIDQVFAEFRSGLHLVDPLDAACLVAVDLDATAPVFHVVATETVAGVSGVVKGREKGGAGILRTQVGVVFHNFCGGSHPAAALGRVFPTTSARKISLWHFGFEFFGIPVGDLVPDPIGRKSVQP